MAIPPSLNIPQSSSTVTVFIIDATVSIPFQVSLALSPAVGGVQQLEANAYCFLIEHAPTGQTVLFDLGARKDFDSNAPALVKRLRSFGFNPKIEKDVSEILLEGGMDLQKVNAVIWSHHHWDHTGDVSKFPTTTELVVGPGVPAKLWPGFPVNQESHLLESDYKGRPAREIEFNSGGKEALNICGFAAFDYFGDGSFYLLDAPGHAIGHMCALARTTASPPSFILMGGDNCHHAGQIRPTEYLPLPDTIQPSPLVSLAITHMSSCPGEMFLSMHHNHSRTEPFYNIAMDKNGASLAHVDVGAAKSTIEKTKELDSNESVFVIMAHDASLKHVLSYWPQSANGWQEAGWKPTGTWRFLADFVKKDDKEVLHL